MFNWDGVTLIPTILNDTRARSSWTMWVPILVTCSKVSSTLGLWLYEYLPFAYGCYDWHGFGLQLVVCVRKLVPWNEAFDSTGNGEDYEGEPGLPRPTRAYTEGSAALFVWAYGTILEQSELLRVVLEPNHLWDISFSLSVPSSDIFQGFVDDTNVYRVTMSVDFLGHSSIFTDSPR